MTEYQLKQKIKKLEAEFPILNQEEQMQWSLAGSLSEHELKLVSLGQFARIQRSAPVLDTPLTRAARYPDMLHNWRKTLHKKQQDYEDAKDRLERKANPIYSLRALMDEQAVPRRQIGHLRQATVFTWEQLQADSASTAADCTVSTCEVRIGAARVQLVGLPTTLAFVSLTEDQTNTLKKTLEEPTALAAVKIAIVALQQEEDFAQLKQRIGTKVGVRRPCSWAELLDQLGKQDPITHQPQVEFALIPFRDKNLRFSVKDNRLMASNTLREFVIPVCAPTTVDEFSTGSGEEPDEHHEARACVPLCYVARIVASRSQSSAAASEQRLASICRRQGSSTSLPFSVLRKVLGLQNPDRPLDIETLLHHISPRQWLQLTSTGDTSVVAPHLVQLMAKTSFAPPAEKHEANGDVVLDPGQLTSPAEFDACIVWFALFSPQPCPPKAFLVCESHIMHLQDFARYSVHLDLNMCFTFDQTNVSGMLKVLKDRFEGREEKGVRLAVLRFHGDVSAHDLSRVFHAVTALPNLVSLAVYTPLVVARLQSLGLLARLPPPDMSAYTSVYRYLHQHANPQDSSTPAVFVCSMVPRSAHQLVPFQSDGGRGMGDLFLMTSSLASPQSQLTLPALYTAHVDDLAELREQGCMRWPRGRSLRVAINHPPATAQAHVLVVVEREAPLLQAVCLQAEPNTLVIDCKTELAPLSRLQDLQGSKGGLPSVVCFAAAHLLSWRTRTRLIKFLAGCKVSSASAHAQADANRSLDASFASSTTSAAAASTGEARAPTVVMQETTPEPRYAAIRDVSVTTFRYGIDCNDEMLALVNNGDNSSNNSSSSSNDIAASDASPEQKAQQQQVLLALALVGSPLKSSRKLWRAVSALQARHSGARSNKPPQVPQDLSRPVLRLLDFVLQPGLATVSSSTALDLVCSSVALAARCQQGDSSSGGSISTTPLTFQQFLELSGSATFAPQRIRVALFVAYLQAWVSAKKAGMHAPTPLEEATFMDTLKTVTESQELMGSASSLAGAHRSGSGSGQDGDDNLQGLRLYNTLTWDILSGFAQEVEGGRSGDSDVPVHMQPSAPTYKLSPFDDWLSTREGLFDAVSSDQGLDWNRLTRQWAVFPFGATELAHMLSCATHPLACLLGISTNSLRAILETGVLKQHEQLASLQRTLVFQLNGLGKLLDAAMASSSTPLVQAAAHHKRAAAALKWLLVYHGLVNRDQFAFSLDELKHILSVMEVGNSNSFTPQLTTLLLGLNIDLNSHPGIRTHLASVTIADVTRSLQLHPKRARRNLLEVGSALIFIISKASEEVQNTESDATLAKHISDLTQPSASEQLHESLALTADAVGCLLQQLCARAGKKTLSESTDARARLSAAWRLALASLDRMFGGDTATAEHNAPAAVARAADYLNSCVTALSSVSAKLIACFALRQAVEQASCNATSGGEGCVSSALLELCNDNRGFAATHDPILRWAFLSAADQAARGELVLDALREARPVGCCYAWGAMVAPSNGHCVLWTLLKNDLAAVKAQMAEDDEAEREQSVKSMTRTLMALFPPRSRDAAEEAIRCFRGWVQDKGPADLQLANEDGVIVASLLWCLFPGAMAAPPLWKPGPAMEQPDRKLLLSMINSARSAGVCTAHPLLQFGRAVFSPHTAAAFPAQTILHHLHGKKEPEHVMTTFGNLLLWPPRVGAAPKLHSIITNEQRQHLVDALQQANMQLNWERQEVLNVLLGDLDYNNSHECKTVMSLRLTEGLSYDAIAHILKTLLVIKEVRRLCCRCETGAG